MAERNPGLSAHKEQSEGGDRLIKVFIYLGAVCALLVVALLVMFFRRTNSFNVHAFRVPSDSMCPTLCSGDRLVADMDAFVKSGPQPGDVYYDEAPNERGPLHKKGHRCWGRRRFRKWRKNPSQWKAPRRA
jgi:signal peptidase I